MYATILNNNTMKTTEPDKKVNGTNQRDTRIITTPQHKYKYKLKMKKTFKLLIEKINYLATYTTILNEDRDVCVAETSVPAMPTTAITLCTRGQREGRLLHALSVHGKG